MRIGELARRSGIGVETIRYYEQRGLLRSPKRTRGGHRSYEDSDVRRLLAVRALSRLGMSLDEVRDFVESTGHPQAEPAFLARLASNAAALARQARVLATVHDRCRRGAGLEEVLATLAADTIHGDDEPRAPIRNYVHYPDRH